MKVVDTTAHTLAAALGFLGLHEDIQEEVYEHIISVVGSDRDPVRVVQVFSSIQNPHSFWLLKVFDDYPKLDKVLGVFYEALRMFRSSSPLTFSLSCLPDIGIQYSRWPSHDPRSIRRYCVTYSQSSWAGRSNHCPYTERATGLHIHLLTGQTISNLLGLGGD